MPLAQRKETIEEKNKVLNWGKDSCIISKEKTNHREGVGDRSRIGRRGWVGFHFFAERMRDPKRFAFLSSIERGQRKGIGNGRGEGGEGKGEYVRIDISPEQNSIFV